MSEAGPDHAGDAEPVTVPVVLYSNNLINNTDNNQEYYIDITSVIAGVPDTICETEVSRLAESVEARGEDAYEQAVLSDDVPSSQGTPIGTTNSAFELISYIKTQFITEYNADNGPFRNIQKMIHSLFYSMRNYGFVGFTPAGLLSEYTATIYYAATDSFIHYQNIIKIILRHIADPVIDRGRNITYTFKLDRGVKPGDTIKLILSLTFGTGVGANVILVPVLNIVGFNLSSTNGDVAVTSIENFITPIFPPTLLGLTQIGSFSIFDLIARIRLYANQEAFGALIEPTDAEKDLIRYFFNGITRDGLVAFINFIKFAFYTDARIPTSDKNFAFFLNIFFNFYKVSMNAANTTASLSTAKIMYTNFFSNHNNYGSIIRIFNNMMSFPLFNQHAIMFLSGSNAARAYKLIEEILIMNTTEMNAEQIQVRREQIYDTHMATLSDNDFMFYLLNEDSEPYRLAIRMMLGACLYYLKYILNSDDRVQYTNLLEESISIVGHDDHLFAQRLNANEVFLRRCFHTIRTYTDTAGTTQNITIDNILGFCNFHDFNFYSLLSGNVTLAFLDVVFKHNTAESWYISVFSIFGITRNLDGTTTVNIYEVTPVRAADGSTIVSYSFDRQQVHDRVVTQEEMTDVLNFLTTQAMAVNCIATPWTLILNILYTIFVTENCVARIVVGKLGNDPKNLEKYFSILNTHLNYLLGQYNTHTTTEDKTAMIEKITRIGQLQTYITQQSQLCQRPESLDNPLSTRYNTLKSFCTVWVQQMFILALAPATRELFFLSAAYPFTTREATLLEKGICCAWTLHGNICNNVEFLAQFNTTNVHAITVANFRPVYTGGTASEQLMHQIVPQLQGIINGAITASKTVDFNVTPSPPLAGQEPQVNHYAYMNYLWKHLTKTSIDLRSMFKSIVKDLKRIVGSKNFTAISLAGAYPCGLLIDELKESNNINLTDVELTQLKNSGDIINCRRGLLPLLVPADPNSTLFARMVVELLHIDYTGSGNNPETYSTNNILIFLGFLFSIKIKSNASIGPRNMLSLVDSIINFPTIPNYESLLQYTGTDVGPVAAGTCSLAKLSVNPDANACATGGVEHTGGAPTKKASTAKAPAAKASAAPIKASEAIATGVSKSEAKSKPDAKKLKNALAITDKIILAAQHKEKNALAITDKIILAAQHKEKKEAAVAPIAARAQLLNPTNGPFKKFMDKIQEVLTTGITATDGTVIIKAGSIPFNHKTCITGITRQGVFNIDTFYNTTGNPYAGLRTSVGGSNNKTKANNKTSKTNNHTRRNKNKRKKNSKSKTKTKFKTKSSPKHKKVIPSSRSGSQSNRKKSKPKKSQKNVTFKRRRARK